MEAKLNRRLSSNNLLKHYTVFIGSKLKLQSLPPEVEGYLRKKQVGNDTQGVTCQEMEWDSSGRKTKEKKIKEKFYNISHWG